MSYTIDKTDILIKAQELRKKLGEDDESPMDIFALALSIDKLTLVKYPMGEHLSGMCIKSQNSNIIAINSSMTLGRQRFSLGHELYHLYYDENMSAICNVAIGKGLPIEKEADQFASYFLIPPVSLKRKIQELKGSKPSRVLFVDDIVRLEQYFGVSRQAILIRLIDDRQISRIDAESMSRGVINSAARLGFSDELYRCNKPEKQYGVYGSFIERINKAYEKELISDGKYEEMLLQAFRSDLVYGDEEGGEVLD